MSTPQKYSFARALSETLKYNAPIGPIEADFNARSAAKFGAKAAFSNGKNQVMYLRLSEFRKDVATRADVSLPYANFAGIRPAYQGSVVAHSQVFKAGCSVLENLTTQVYLTGTSQLSQPVYSTAPDGTTAIIESDPVFTPGSVNTVSQIYSPLRLGFKVTISNQLLLQGGELFASIIKDISSRALSSVIDNLALFGTGTANGQPLGLYSVITPTNLATASISFTNWQTVRESVLESDLSPDSLAVITSPAYLNVLDSTIFSSGASYTLADRIRQYCSLLVGNEINTSSPSGKNALFIGLWRNLFVMFWSDLELVFDRYSKLDSAETVLRGTVLANIGINVPASFAAIRQN